MTTPRLGAPELVTSQTNKEETVNEQIRYIESGAGHFIFKDRDLTAPPGSPADGDCYLVKATGTGAWAGHDGDIAFRLNTTWVFIEAIEGFTAWVNDENLFIGYDGAAWNTLSSPSGVYLPLTGGTLSGDLVVPDEAYDATAWNGSLEVPTKNAVRDKIEDILDGVTFTGDIVVPDEAYDATNWNGSLEVPTKNAVRDKIETLSAGAYTDEQAQDAVGGMVDSSLTYVDATPLLQRAALTGDVTASAGSNATTVANANYSATLTATGTPVATSLGYLGSPINTQNGAYTTVMTDSGKTIYHTSGSAHTWTIDSNANVAYPLGTILTFINENGGGNVTLAITSDTLRWGSSTGSRTLAANGTATAIKVATTTWRLTGDGLT